MLIKECVTIHKFNSRYRSVGGGQYVLLIDWLPLEAKNCSKNLFHSRMVNVLFTFRVNSFILYSILLLEIILFWTLLEL